MGWSTLGWACAFAVCSFCANAQTFSWNWTGFYVGVDAGIISSRSFSSTQATAPVTATPYLDGPSFTGTLATFNNAVVDTISARGTEVGVHAGYNWQLKPLVVGVEVDYGAFRTRAVRDSAFLLCVTGAPGCVTGGILSQLHSETNTDWLFTVRPRIGWVYSVLYGYITGGAAFTDIRASTLYTEVGGLTGAPRVPTGFVATSQSKAGWVIGGGLEVAIAPRWTLRAEYLRVEFSGATGVGQITNPGVVPATFNPIALSADHKSDIVRVGVTHKFQWWFEEPVPPVAPGPVVVTKD
jgi:outer membrane immunogenic protein